MRPVLQTITTGPGQPGFGPGNVGNCAQAAFASLLELELDEVPHFADYPADHDEANDPLTAVHGGLYWRRVRRFLRTMGLDAGAWPPDVYLSWAPSALAAVEDLDPRWRCAIAGGTSPRGFPHVVVVDASTGVLVHDPHPSGGGLTDVEEIVLVIDPYDPAPPTLGQEAEVRRALESSGRR